MVATLNASDLHTLEKKTRVAKGVKTNGFFVFAQGNYDNLKNHGLASKAAARQLMLPR
jgi:hypothetical protein